jgi:hypothetical protein
MKKSTGSDQRPILGPGENRVATLTDVEDYTVATTKTVSDERTAEGSETGPDGQNRRDERVGRRWQSIAAVGLQLAVDFDKCSHFLAA